MRGKGASTEVARKWDYRDTKIDAVPKWMGSQVANPFLDAFQKFIFRSLGAEDKIFKGIRFEQSILDQALTAATRAGDRTKGGELYDSWRANGYENLPDDVYLRAVGDAEVSTFTDRSLIAAGSSQAKAGFREFARKDPTGLAENAAIFVTEGIAPFTGTPSKRGEQGRRSLGRRVPEGHMGREQAVEGRLRGRDGRRRDATSGDGVVRPLNRRSRWFRGARLHLVQRRPR